MSNLDFTLPDINIYLEDGTLKKVHSVNDLPFLTTGLLIMNQLKRHENIKRNVQEGTLPSRVCEYDQTAETTLVYLYFLRNCHWYGFIRVSTLKILYEVFPYILKTSLLSNLSLIDPEFYCLYNERFLASVKIKELLDKILDDEQRDYVSERCRDITQNVYSILSYSRGPLPEYLTHQENFDLYLKKINPNLVFKNELEKINSIAKYLAHCYGVVLRHQLNKLDLSLKNDWFSSEKESYHTNKG